jgi:hypothetical protein
VLEVQIWKRAGARGVDAYPIFHKSDVFLAAGSRKSVSFTIDPDFLSRPLRIGFSSPTHQVAREIDLRPHFSTKPLLLLVSGSNVPLSLPLPGDLTNHLVTTRLADLPSDPRAYLGIWAVLFYEQPLRELSRAQSFALETWILWGGKIVALGGLSPAVFQDANWARLLPITVSGLKKLSTLSKLEDAYSAKVVGREFTVHDARLRESRSLIEQQGQPILVESARGKGRVMFVAVDLGRPPLSNWSGLARLLGDLLGAAPEPAPVWESTWDDTFFSRVVASPSFLPNHAPVLVYTLWVLTYGLVLAALIKYTRTRQSGRAVVLIAFLGAPVLFAAAGHLYFDRGGKPLDGVLLSATMLEGSPSGHAEAYSNVALFSMRHRSYRLQIGRGWSHLEMVSIPGGKSENRSLGLSGGSLASELDFSLGEWNHRLFRIHSVQRFPVQVQVLPESQLLRLHVANQSGHTLTECWFVASGKGFFLGDLSPGSSLIREFPRAAQEGSASGGLSDISFSDPFRGLLFHHSFFANRSKDFGDSGLFLGWVQDAPREIRTADTRVHARHHTLFQTTLPLEREEEL